MYPDVSGTYSNFNWSGIFNSLAQAGSAIANSVSGGGYPVPYFPNQYPYAAYSGYFPAANPYAPAAFNPNMIGQAAGGGGFNPRINTASFGFDSGSGVILVVAAIAIIVLLVK